MPKNLDNLGCPLTVVGVIGMVVIVMGGTPSKGTRKDKRLKKNKKK